MGQPLSPQPAPCAAGAGLPSGLHHPSSCSPALHEIPHDWLHASRTCHGAQLERGMLTETDIGMRWWPPSDCPCLQGAMGGCGTGRTSIMPEQGFSWPRPAAQGKSLMPWRQEQEGRNGWNRNCWQPYFGQYPTEVNGMLLQEKLDKDLGFGSDRGSVFSLFILWVEP